MAEDFNRQWNEQQSLSEAQRHANMAEAAKRGEQHYQGSSKPPSQVWDRLYSGRPNCHSGDWDCRPVGDGGLCRLGGRVIRLNGKR